MENSPLKKLYTDLDGKYGGSVTKGMNGNCRFTSFSKGIGCQQCSEKVASSYYNLAVIYAEMASH
jgi:hypothetical protein